MSLVFDQVGLVKDGPTLSMVLEPGQTLCVVGRASCGKSRLLRVASGAETATRGTVDRPSRLLVPEPCNRKLRPQDLSHTKGANRAQLATDVLSNLGLWDARQKLISELAPAQIAACDLVETFMGASGLIVLDENLDRLDPWIRAQAMQLVRDRCGHGSVAIVATNCLDLVSQFDFVVALKASRPAYAGSVSKLASERSQRSLTIESERTVGVRSLVDSLLVEVARTESGYKLTPGPGQEHAARLLRDGYGDVKFVVSDDRSLAEIILGLL